MPPSKLIFLLAISGILALSACNNLQKAKANLTEPASSTTNTPEQVQSLSVVKLENSYAEQDTIKYDTEYFPGDMKFIAKLLRPGDFHEDEVQVTAEKKNWYGLFKGKSDWYLAKTKIKTTKVFDEIVDEDSLVDKTGWRVQTLNKDTSLILISGLNFLAGRKIKPVVLSKNIIYPGETLRFNYAGLSYKLFATGGKNKEQEDPEWFYVWNYKLYLSAKKNGKVKTELLVAAPRFNDTMTSIIFVGDIDGDGFPDLLIDTSNHYNSEEPTLYLSKPAEKGHLYKVVGKHSIVGC